MSPLGGLRTYSPYLLLHNVMRILAADGRRPQPCYDESAARAAGLGGASVIHVSARQGAGAGSVERAA